MGFSSIARTIRWRAPVLVLRFDNKPRQPQTPTSAANHDSPDAGAHPTVVPAGFKLIWVALAGFLRALWYSIGRSLRYLWHHPIQVVLNLAFLVVVAVMLMTGSEIHKQMILGKISDQTIDKIIEASQFTRDFDSTAASRDATREFQRVGAPNWIQRESIRAILYHARKAGLPIEDQAVLLTTAEIESGFNPMARAVTTTACGIFQFVQRTGQIFELSPVECMNPWLNARSGVDHYVSNYEQRVRKDVGSLSGAEKVFRTFELSYYLHHDGPNSSNPSNDLKATVLSGTQFLFKVFHVLEQEADSEEHAPSFAQIFSEKLWGLLDRFTSLVEESHIPSFGLLRSAENSLPQAAPA